MPRSIFVVLPVAVTEEELKAATLAAGGEWFELPFPKGYIDKRGSHIHISLLEPPDYIYRPSQYRFIKLCLGFEVQSIIDITLTGSRPLELALQFANDSLIARYGGFVDMDDPRVSFKETIRALAAEMNRNNA